MNMANKSTSRVSVVVPNWNGKKVITDCLDSLLTQSFNARILVVENASTDGSLEFLQQKYPQVTVLVNQKNLGFAGGVNTGIRQAIEDGDEFVALINNDAVADKNWLKHLVHDMRANSDTGISTCKLLDASGKHIDSTGEMYTNWGLPYPRGRGEAVSDHYDDRVEVFAASGGASLYRVKMLQEIGLFDEDFFAYYEDVDLSFRAQLAGWKVRYVPEAEAYHQIGATSGKIKGFTTYQTMKNLPLVVYKNVPRKLLWRVGPRYLLSHYLFFARAVSRGQGMTALKGDSKATALFFKKRKDRRRIQQTRKVSDDYIWAILTHDLPPNAKALRKLRATWWKLTFHKAKP